MEDWLGEHVRMLAVSTDDDDDGDDDDDECLHDLDVDWMCQESIYL